MSSRMNSRNSTLMIFWGTLFVPDVVKTTDFSSFDSTNSKCNMNILTSLNFLTRTFAYWVRIVLRWKTLALHLGGYIAGVYQLLVGERGGFDPTRSTKSLHHSRTGVPTINKSPRNLRQGAGSIFQRWVCRTQQQQWQQSGIGCLTTTGWITKNIGAKFVASSAWTIISLSCHRSLKKEQLFKQKITAAGYKKFKK